MPAGSANAGKAGNATSSRAPRAWLELDSGANISSRSLSSEAAVDLSDLEHSAFHSISSASHSWESSFI